MLRTLPIFAAAGSLLVLGACSFANSPDDPVEPGASTATSGGGGEGGNAPADPVCGDGKVEGAEICDDAGESKACNADCTKAECGDGVLNKTAGEVCDDKGESDMCNADCTAVSCGDGVVNMAAGEECDDMVESQTCNADCTSATCGDSKINVTAGEECDEGDADAGDGCDDSCKAEGSCMAPLPLTLSEQSLSLDGVQLTRSASGVDDIAEASCGSGVSGAGPARVYSIELKEARDLTVSLTSDFDGSLRLLTDPCDTTKEVDSISAGCANKAGTMGTETLSLPNVAAGTYYIAVEGVGTSDTGNFTLDVGADCPRHLVRFSGVAAVSGGWVDLRNDNKSCTVDLEDLYLSAKATNTSQPVVIALTNLSTKTRYVSPGTVQRVAGQPSSGDIDAKKNIPMFPNVNTTLMLQRGAFNATDATTVIDAFQSAYTGPAPSLLPSGVTFSGSALNFVADVSEQNHIFFERTGTKANAPNFLSSDWSMGFIAPTLLYEGFENNPLFNSMWIKGNDIVGTASSTPSWVNAVGKQALYSIGGNTSHKLGWHRVLPSLKPKYVSFRVGTYSATGNSASGYVLLGPNNSSTSVAAFFYMGPANNMTINGNVLQSYEAQKMYNVRLQFDWTTKRLVSVYVDNVLRATNVDFLNQSVNDIDRIDLYNYFNAGVFYDDIRFYN